MILLDHLPYGGFQGWRLSGLAVVAYKTRKLVSTRRLLTQLINNSINIYSLKPASQESLILSARHSVMLGRALPV